MDGINQSVFGVSKRAMIDPDLLGSVDTDGIAISFTSFADVCSVTHDLSMAGDFGVVDVNAMDDDIVDILQGEASSTGDVDFHTAAVNGFVAGEDELLLELDCHASLECDPQRLQPSDRVPESARLRIGNIVIAIRSYSVYLPVPSSYGISSESLCT